jgi:hypothetical protein
MNFDTVDPITPGYGLCQGDPLSPYLLILVVEGPTSLIHYVVGRGGIHWVRVCINVSEVSHLLFCRWLFLVLQS